MGYLPVTLALVCLCAVHCLAEEEDRDRRQTPYLFHNQQQPRGQVQRPLGGPQPSTPGFPRFSGPPPQGFRPSPALVDESEEDDQSEEVERNVLQFSRPPHASPSPSTPIPFRPTQSGPLAQPQQLIQQQVLKSRPLSPGDFAPTPGPQRRLPLQAQSKPGRYPSKAELTEQEEQEILDEQKEEEPDRLTELLPHSKFSCSGKKTGYYADDGLNCEVFHYCQDSARHSWVCPEGFLFHQVHLICMPPSSDNICQESAQYHFVNDFLYKAINEEEVQRKPNVSLRYADRYYPQNYYQEEDQEEEPSDRRPALQVGLPRPQGQPQPTQRPQVNYRHYSPAASNQNQVFHSPEEVNIPLQNRRPTSPAPPSNVQVQNSYRFQ